VCGAFLMPPLGAAQQDLCGGFGGAHGEVLVVSVDERRELAERWPDHRVCLVNHDAGADDHRAGPFEKSASRPELGGGFDPVIHKKDSRPRPDQICLKPQLADLALVIDVCRWPGCRLGCARSPQRLVAPTGLRPPDTLAHATRKLCELRRLAGTIEGP
jgi:hypothetical protein